MALIGSLAGIGLLGARPALSQSAAEIKRRGKVVIGIQGDNPPWGFINAQGQQEGLDADVGRLFAQYLGTEVEFLPLAVANRIPSLVAGRADVLFATMGMYPDRAKAVQFSQPYAATQIQFVAPNSAKVAAASDIKDMTVGVARSSANDTATTAAVPPGTAIRRFDDDAATIQALLSGQVDAVGANQFYMARLNKARPDFYEVKLTFLTQYNGAATRLGQKEWNATVNAFLDKIKSNGQLAGIYEKWIGSPLPAFPATMDGIPFTVS